MLYSAEFRRLAGVTQVIPPQEEYVFHDRLTHTLKVAQIAERLAQYVIRNFSKENSCEPDEINVNPRVCHVAALVHDIGHPPFGHGAEYALQSILENSLAVGAVTNRPVLTDSFEGNAQSFRTVAQLSLRKAENEPPGLNLTWRSLAAASKYPWSKGGHPPLLDDKLSRKWGFYDSEKPYLEHLQNNGLVPSDGSRCVEAEIMDFADDISYAVHDVEDFFKSGRIPLSQLAFLRNAQSDQWSEIFDFACANACKLLPEINASIDNPDEHLTPDDITKHCETVFNKNILEYIPKVEFRGTRESHANLQSFASGTIEKLQSGCKLVGDLENLTFQVSIESRITAECLKSLTKFYVVNDPMIHTMQRGQRVAIEQIFEYLHTTAVEVFVDSRLNERILPSRFVEYIDICMNRETGSGFNNDESRLARAAVDFLCTLTDRQARLMHQRIVGDSAAALSPYAFKL